MLTPYDDYPLHQTADVITQPATGDPNHYDRYFFNGHDGDGEMFFGVAMGHYPNRNVIDSAFCVVRDGAQHSVYASGYMPKDRSTSVGPLRIEVLEPLRTLRVTVAPNDTGIEANLVYRARTAAIEEPRQRIVRNDVMIMDYTRLTQWGTWEGTVTVDGITHEVSASRFFGTRDRSWGVRGVGPQVPSNRPPSAPQIFWLWAPLHFDDMCTHLAMFEHANGDRWLQQGLIVPTLASADAPTWGLDMPQSIECHDIAYKLAWRPGTREMATAELSMTAEGKRHTIEFERLFTFRMRGIGYGHPKWLHGSPHGALEVGGEVLAHADINPEEGHNIHIQTVCRVKMGDRRGVGILEQLVFGDHQPTGLKGITTGFSA